MTCQCLAHDELTRVGVIQTELQTYHYYRVLGLRFPP